MCCSWGFLEYIVFLFWKKRNTVGSHLNADYWRKKHELTNMFKKNKFRRPMILVSETLVQSMSCPFRKQDLRLWNNFGPIFLICFEFRRRITCVKDIKVYIFTIFHKGHLHLDSLVLTKSVMDFSKKHLTYTFLFRFSFL